MDLTSNDRRRDWGMMQMENSIHVIGASGRDQDNRD
jgi:hypothetical protein